MSVILRCWKNVLRARYYDDKESQNNTGTTTVNSTTGVGIVTTPVVDSSVGTITSNFYENSNTSSSRLAIGIEKVFKFNTSKSGSMFSIKYQLFLNDMGEHPMIYFNIRW